MHPNAELLTRFYEAFNRKEPAVMRAAYAPDATFQDPAFSLQGPAIGDMWTMLCERAKDFRLEFRDVQADDTTGVAHWEAWYLFNGRRPVHNVIDASFTFREGLIVTHRDQFSFYRWSSQALGVPGLLLGWTGFMRRTVRQRSRKLLEGWQAKR